MTTWTNSSNLAPAWSNKSTVLVVSGYKKYDESGLIYDLSGQSYEWQIPRSSHNENYIWDKINNNNTIWQ